MIKLGFNKNLTLDKLEIGKDAIISSINCKDKALRRHILNMGLTPNVEVSLIKAAPLGDPLELEVRGYLLTIRKEDASKIEIKDIHKAHNIQKENKIFKDIEHSQKGEELTYLERNKNKVALKTKLKFALAGNQNSGKTTLFNKLTGSNQHVGNFPGVTVDKVEGIIKNNNNMTITDLPGIYSLSPYSKEEIVTRDFLLNENPNCIINIIDATNIERNLLLTTELLELEIPMVIALNMMDEVQENNGSIDVNGLENALGVPVIPISASKDEGIDELLEHAINVARYEDKPKKLDFCSSESAVHRCIHSIIHLIEDHAKASKLPIRFVATKLIEGDKSFIDELNLDDDEIKNFKQIILQMEKENGLDREAALIDMRFSFIEKLCDDFVYKSPNNAGKNFSNNLDKILTGKYTALPSFLLIISFIFYLTFGPLGTFLSDLMTLGIDGITKYIDSSLALYGLNSIVKSLIIDGVCAGVGGVLIFLPVIVVLFFFLSLLEDSGYMARVAFIMDKLLRKIGLSGRSFVPMLIGFGCSVPAIMATRTLPSERDRKMTIFLIPFMSCSAKLPIYALFTMVFFKENQVLVIISLYLIGIIVGLFFAYLMKFLVFKNNPVPFVMELPNYRMPTSSNVIRLIYSKSKNFITKAFTIIFWATIVIWFLKTFDNRLNLVSMQQDSLLASLGNLLVPVFEPLGMGDWKIATSFITGFLAKESVISTLTVLLDGDISKLPLLFTPITAFGFLIFSLLYVPCVATIATVKRELGKRYACAIILLQCLIAWTVAWAFIKIFTLYA